MRRILGHILFLAVVASAAQGVASDFQETEAAITRAHRAMDAGNFHRALNLLSELSPATDTEKTEVLFLTGLASLNAATQDSENRELLLEDAVSAFRKILVKQPGLTRVRLELARAFFEQGKDKLSKREFERALSGELPPAVKKNINRFLNAIKARRRFRSDFTISIVPESHINRNRTVLVETNDGYFFPFRLDESPESGIGVDMRLGSNYTLPLTDKWSVVSSADIRRLEYKGDYFDRMNLKLTTGLKRFFSPGNDLFVDAAVNFNYEMDEHEETVYQLSFGASRRWTPRFSLNGAVSVFKRENSRDGADFQISLDGKYQLFPTVLLGTTGIFAHVASEPELSQSRQRQIEFRLGWLLPKGVTFNALLALQWRHYNTNFLVLGGGDRNQEVRTLQAALLKRDWTVFGFSPQVSILWQTSDTNYQLDNYSSVGYQINFQRQF